MSAPEIKQASSGWWVVADGRYAAVAETRDEALRRYRTLLPPTSEPVRAPAGGTLLHEIREPSPA
ncbi:MAG TPA: hypothetical protein VFS62_10260 [Chloroflexota bacterium]|jgi:hypothetical protein|nr:hypothetical protein [Chloroflexota bacterium]